MKIASAKDLDLLLAELKGNTNDAMIIAATEKTQDTTSETHDSGFMTPVGDVTEQTTPKSAKNDSGMKVKLFKLHMELCKVKEQLE
jgi:hypothetical protein